MVAGFFLTAKGVLRKAVTLVKLHNFPELQLCGTITASQTRDGRQLCTVLLRADS
jgi:hypothetical protein